MSQTCVTCSDAPWGVFLECSFKKDLVKPSLGVLQKSLVQRKIMANLITGYRSFEKPNET